MKTKLSCFFLIIVLILAPLSVYGQDKVIIPIILYHCIEENYPESMSNLAITSNTFEQHMQALKAAGYTPINFKEYYDYTYFGVPLPEKPILITFDDGYLSNYLYAYPILKQFGFKATFFIVVNSVGKPTGGEVVYPHFTWDEAREMEQSDLIDIESHTYYHHDMRQSSIADAQEDLRLSKYTIDTNLNKNCHVLAYPYGFYNSTVQKLAEKAGYDVQCIVGDTGANTITTPINELKRLTVSGNQTPQDLLNMIDKNCRAETN